MNKIILLLFPLSLFANQFDPNILVDPLQDKHLVVSTNQCLEDGDDDIQNTLNACAVSICGEPNAEKSAIVTGEKLNALIDESIEEKFKAMKPKIKESLETSLKYAKKLIEEKERRSELLLSPWQTEKVILDAILPNLDITYNKDTEELDISYDKEIEGFEKKFVDKFIDKLKQNTPKDFNLKVKLGLPISKEELGKAASELQLKIISHSPTGQRNSELENSLQAIKQIATNTTYSFYSAKAISDMVFFFNYHKSIAYSSMKDEDFYGLCGDLKCKKYVEKIIVPAQKKKLILFKKYVNSIDNKVLDRIVKSCKGPLYYDEMESEFIFSKFENLKNSGAKRALSFVKERFSEETYNKFSQYIRYDVFYQKDNRDYRQMDYTENMLQAGVHDRAQKDKLINTLSSKNDNEINKLFNSQFYYGAPYLSALQFKCNSNMEDGLGIVDDNYNYVFNRIKISHFSSNNPETGHAIFAHELGHAFSEIIQDGAPSKESLNTYLKIRKCVNDQYLIPDYKDNSYKRFSNDHFRSEEDMADLFSFMLEKHEPKSNGSIGLCSLFGVKENSYIGLSDENIPHDNHSSTLIRILRLHHYAGKEFSPSCQKIIERNKHLWQFKDCGR